MHGVAASVDALQCALYVDVVANCNDKGLDYLLTTMARVSLSS